MGEEHWRSFRQASVTPEGLNEEESRDLIDGIDSHFEADRAFHTNPVFENLCLESAQRIRRVYGTPSTRVSFMVHVSIELLLDATLSENDPELLPRYYETLERVDGQRLESGANQIHGSPLPQFQLFLRRFLESRFLYSYATDASLLERLQQILRRARLEPAHPSFTSHLQQLRVEVQRQWKALLGSWA